MQRLRRSAPRRDQPLAQPRPLALISPRPDLCAGEEILIIDADLQDPPELLTDMRAAMRSQGADVVYACAVSVRARRSSRRSPPPSFYRMLDRITIPPIPLDTGDFRLMTRRALDALLSPRSSSALHPRYGRSAGFKQVPFPMTIIMSAMPRGPNIRSLAR